MTVHLDAITHPKQRGPLVAVQELDGKTIFVDKGSFARAGLLCDDLIGVSWRDFTPPGEHDAEQSVIDGVLRSGMPAFPKVIRQWPSATVNLVNKTSVLTTKGGTQLLMREAHLIDPVLGAPIDLLLDATGPFAQLDALHTIAQTLNGAIGLARREEWDLLGYLITLARLQADEQRMEIQKSVLA